MDAQRRERQRGAYLLNRSTEVGELGSERSQSERVGVAEFLFGQAPHTTLPLSAVAWDSANRRRNNLGHGHNHRLSLNRREAAQLKMARKSMAKSSASSFSTLSLNGSGSSAADCARSQCAANSTLALDQLDSTCDSSCLKETAYCCRERPWRQRSRLRRPTRAQPLALSSLATAADHRRSLSRRLVLKDASLASTSHGRRHSPAASTIKLGAHLNSAARPDQARRGNTFDKPEPNEPHYEDDAQSVSSVSSVSLRSTSSASSSFSSGSSGRYPPATPPNIGRARKRLWVAPKAFPDPIQISVSPSEAARLSAPGGSIVVAEAATAADANNTESRQLSALGECDLQLHHHRGQYSSSQAHLQSLTETVIPFSATNFRNISLQTQAQHRQSAADVVGAEAASSNSLKRLATTTTTPTSLNCTQTTGRHPFRSQQQLFSPSPSSSAATLNSIQIGTWAGGGGGGGGGDPNGCANSGALLQNNGHTKPMTSMTPKSGSSATNLSNFEPYHTNPPQAHNQQQQLVAASCGRPAPQNGQQPSQNQFQCHHNQLPPPYNSVATSGADAQFVICQQPDVAAVCGGVRRELLQQQPGAAPLTGHTPAQARPVFNFSTGPMQHQQTLRQQQAHQASPAPHYSQRAAPATASESGGQANGPQVAITAGAAQSNAIISSGNNYQPLNASRQQQQLIGHTLCSNGSAAATFSKSKSCLACADISIKWYIVVIALLGLICALIGTIVGAVHSVGRDYISLSLLLVGVGLVLIAVSWIALKITVDTYRSSSSGSLTQPPAAFAGGPFGSRVAANSSASLARRATGSRGGVCTFVAGAQQGAHLHTIGRSPSNHRRQQHMAVGNGAQQHQFAAAAVANQAMLNERLYMMAAAAAVAAANSSQRLPSSSSGGRFGLFQFGRGFQSQAPGSNSATASSRLAAIKRLVPRSLARLVGASATTTAGSSTPSTGRARSGSPQTTPPGTRSPDGNSGDSLLTGAANSQTVATAAAANTLAALLHQYHHNHQQTANAAPYLYAPGGGGLAPPVPPPPIHLFAAAAAAAAAAATGNPNGLAHQLHDPLFRPPPPSYNAAMQDQRMRMIMQERATLQQLQQQQQQQQQQLTAPKSGQSGSLPFSTAGPGPGSSNQGTQANLSACGSDALQNASAACRSNSEAPATADERQQGQASVARPSGDCARQTDKPLNRQAKSEADELSGRRGSLSTVINIGQSETTISCGATVQQQRQQGG